MNEVLMAPDIWLKLLKFSGNPVSFRKEVKKVKERFPDIDWYCDRCNAHLNEQPGFDDHKYTWKCTVCGHKNSISSDDIYESEEDFRNYEGD